MKICCRCKLPSENFNKNKSRKDGLDNICRSCRQEYMRENGDKYLYGKEYFREAEKRRRNKEYRKLYMREYLSKYIKTKKYKAYARSDNSIRFGYFISRIIQLKGKNTDGEYFNILGWSYKQFKEKFPIIFRNQHIDHMIPMSWFLADSPISIVNSLENLQLLAASENLRKKNSFSHPVPFEYYRTAIPFILKKYKSRIAYF